jgi:hypothetical protein
MDGSYDGHHIIEAVVALLAPVSITHLFVSTLSFNRKVGERLLALIDGGQVGRVTFLSSAMMQGRERCSVDWLSAELTTRGSRLACGRNHCKLVLVESSDNRHFALEGSMNLRSCKCWEQFALSPDLSLFEWHKKYFEGFFK